MYDPDSYDAYSEFQRRDARELIPYIVSRMDSRQSTRILDFGCGSGYITKNILLPLLSSSSSHNNEDPLLYAIDLSKKMIDFASVKYRAQNVIYMVADLLKEDAEFPCKFHKIFSSHVLHWILDQEKALKKLYDLLHCNGEIGIYFISNAPVFSVYESLAKNPTWALYLSDVINFIPKTHFSKNPSKDIGDIVSRIGFHLQESTLITRKFTFDSLDTMIDAAMAANPFIHRIPLELQDEYRNDFRRCFQLFVSHISTAVEVDYDIILIRAIKI